MRAFCSALALTLLVAGSFAIAQAPEPAAGSEITRADLAVAYQRVDRLFAGDSLSPAQVSEINKGFDQATLAFFQRRFGDALRQIDAQTVTLSPSEQNRDFIRRAAALRVRMEPPVVLVSSDTPVELHIEQLYLPGAPGEPIEGRVEVRDEFGQTRASEDFKLRFEIDRPVHLEMALRGDASGATDNRPWFGKPGRYEIWIASDSYTRAQQGIVTTLPGPSGHYTVVAESLEAVRKANDAKLRKIEASSPALIQALASVKARNNLLTDAPDPENTAQQVLEPLKLTLEIAAEIAALERAEDPFKVRRGDYWRVVKTSATDIPLRVYAPATLDLTTAVPLVIALHGAGVDENAFMDAYGAGRIKELADEHGYLLATPLTYAFSGTGIGTAFDTLVEALGYDYAIDPQRIYVIGHSMGGGATTTLVGARGAKIAAAAVLCGFRGLTDVTQDVPPLLLIAAEHDPLVSPDVIGPAAEAAKAAGHPVEYTMMPNYGHTLVVGDVLPEAVVWLLSKSRP